MKGMNFCNLHNPSSRTRPRGLRACKRNKYQNQKKCKCVSVLCIRDGYTIPITVIGKEGYERKPGKSETFDEILLHLNFYQHEIYVYVNS
jgi:hypothetical protein